MFTVKLKELIDFNENSFCLDGKIMSIKTAFALAKIREAAHKETSFYQDNVRKLVSENAQFDENGDLIFSEDGSGLLIQEGKQEVFSKGMEDLQSLEIEIPCNKIKLSDIENIDIDFHYIGFLMPFIEED